MTRDYFSLEYTLICSSCYDCKWHGGSGQYSLGGGGHTIQDCLDGCKNNPDCIYASISESGYCHLFENCDKKDDAKGAGWIRFKKMGKFCRKLCKFYISNRIAFC